MAYIVYRVHKAMGRPIRFKGLEAQYIGWLGGGVLLLLVLFAVLYTLGIDAYICLGLIGAAGGGLTMYVYRMSNRYGAHGMMKAAAKRKLPRVLKCNSRKLFM